MSDQSKEERMPEEAVESGAEAAADGTGGDYEVVVKLIKENEELKDRALRVAAEMENLRRRTARDVHDARAYAIANFARDMLSVSDNLQRALDAVPEEAQGVGRCRLQGADRRRRHHRAGDALGAGTARRQEAQPRGREVRPELPPGDVRGARTPTFRPTRSCRSCSPATRSATGCCGRRWSASPRAGRSRPPAASLACCGRGAGRAGPGQRAGRNGRLSDAIVDAARISPTNRFPLAGIAV